MDSFGGRKTLSAVCAHLPRSRRRRNGGTGTRRHKTTFFALPTTLPHPRFSSAGRQLPPATAFLPHADAQRRRVARISPRVTAFRLRRLPHRRCSRPGDTGQHRALNAPSCHLAGGRGRRRAGTLRCALVVAAGMAWRRTAYATDSRRQRHPRVSAWRTFGLPHLVPPRYLPRSTPLLAAPHASCSYSFSQPLTAAYCVVVGYNTHLSRRAVHLTYLLRCY